MKTVTFDPAQWQLVPKEPTPQMIEAIRNGFGWEAAYKAMLAAAPQPPEVDQWRTIESATRQHGERVLLWRTASTVQLGFPAIGYALDGMDGWQCHEVKTKDGTLESYHYRVTHWMPLPPNPEGV